MMVLSSEEVVDKLVEGPEVGGGRQRREKTLLGRICCGTS